MGKNHRTSSTGKAGLTEPFLRKLELVVVAVMLDAGDWGEEDNNSSLGLLKLIGFPVAITVSSCQHFLTVVLFLLGWVTPSL